MAKTVGWSDVPDDVLAKIAKCLESRIDVLRIRGVCRSWRSSLDRYVDITTLTPPHILLELPGPCSRRIKRSDIQIDRKLSQTTVYRIQPNGESECPNSAQVWFLKVEELEPNQMRILNPLSYFRGKCLPDSFPKVLNSLDYSITQISKGYAVKDLEKFPYGMSSLTVSTFSHKAVLYPDSIWTPLEDLTIFMLRQKGNLYYCKHGDEKWSPINDKKEKLSDIVVWRNEVYVVNRWGEVWTIDSSMKMIKHTPLYDEQKGGMNHLVVSNGQLHLVERLVICSSLSESDAFEEDTLDEERGSSESDDDVEEGKDNMDDGTQSYEDSEDEMDKHEDDNNDTNGEVEEVKAKNEWEEHDEEGEEGDDEKDEHEEGEDEKEEEEKEDPKNKWVGMEEHGKGEKKRGHQDNLEEQEEGKGVLGENDMKDEPIVVINRYERCCFMWRDVVCLNVYNLDDDLGWVEAKNLGDQVWFMGYESFFCLSTKELPGFKSNCIYLMKQNLDCDNEEDWKHSETGVRVFDMAKRRRKRRMRKVPSFPGPALMFWPSQVSATLSCSK